MMNRIDEKLSQLKQAGKKALIPYVVAGDPTPDATLSILHGLVEQGADVNLAVRTGFGDGYKLRSPLNMARQTNIKEYLISMGAVED